MLNVAAAGNEAMDIANPTKDSVSVISGKTSEITGHVFIRSGLKISPSAISPRTGDIYSFGSNEVSVISG